MAVFASYNVYNMDLVQPMVTVIPYDTVYLINRSNNLITAQVQQTYWGCASLATGDIIGYQSTPMDMKFQANGIMYNLIDENQLKFYWKPTSVTVIPPS